MAAIRVASSMIVREMFRSSVSPYWGSAPMFQTLLPRLNAAAGLPCLRTRYCPVRCAASDSGDGRKKAPARLSQMQQLMQEAEERAASAGNEPIPKITLDHVTVNFARSGGPGGQNVNKVNTKVDMRFNVKNADWLSERVRERIMQMEKNRINRDGELVISSTKTRTQKGNIEDALQKLQAIIDAASYVPPPPSEEQVKRIAKLASVGEQKRLQNKKALSQKKAFRRSRESWD
ncbi:Aminoacyl-tRNA hydrolase [Bertholletia excelsa]